MTARWSLAVAIMFLASIGCSHHKPILPTHGWIREEGNATAKSLEGTVVDMHGRPKEGVLVQVLSPDKTYLIASCHTDAQGGFHFRSHTGRVYLLRFALEGFNDLDLAVSTFAQAHQPLKIELNISN